MGAILDKVRADIEAAGISDDDKAAIQTMARRETNMVGGRYCDNLRSCFDSYKRMGAEAFREMEARGREMIRNYQWR